MESCVGGEHLCLRGQIRVKTIHLPLVTEQLGNQHGHSEMDCCGDSFLPVAVWRGQGSLKLRGSPVPGYCAVLLLPVSWL